MSKSTMLSWIVDCALFVLTVAALLSLLPGRIHTEASQPFLPPSIIQAHPVEVSKSSLQCQVHQTSCAAALLKVINTYRVKIGSPPLHLDWSLTKANSRCVSVSTHLAHLIASITSFSDFGNYAHDQFSESCAAQRSYYGQNVGEYYGSKYDAIIGDFNAMMDEGHAPLGTCEFGHDCSLMNRNFHQVGIAIGFSPALNGWLVVEDFSS